MPTPKKPQDHLAPNAVRAEALNSPVSFSFDGQDWTVVPADATSLEFLAALEDERIIAALRILLGEDQAALLIKGRNATDLEGFFDAMGEAVGSGNL